MSGEVARLYATIGADTRGFQAGLSSARNSLVQFGSGLNTYRQQLFQLGEALKNAGKGDVARASIQQLDQALSQGKMSIQQYDAAVRQIQLDHGLASSASQAHAAQITALTNSYISGNITVQQYTAALKKQAETVEQTENSQKGLGSTLQGLLGNYMNLRFMVTDAARAIGDFLGPAAQFETTMSRIAGLTDVPAEQLGKISAGILSMAKSFPQSAQDLGEGMYFIASSGFAGAEGLDILKASAMASAAGLGETKIIADAVTSTLMAYKMKASDAAMVTDVLTEAVAQGKGEPAELAGALGRVLPIAAAAGVSLQQVAASMATMTRTGLNADEAATALRGTIGALIAPGKQARDALASMGITVQDLQDSIRQRGLLVTLQDLMTKTGGNVEQLDLIIPNIRALTGVLSTAGSQGDAYAQVLDRMENATGRTAKAFDIASKTAEFQGKRLENSLQSIGDALARSFLPGMTKAAEATSRLLNWQSDLSTAFQGHQDDMREKLVSGQVTLAEYNTEIERSARVSGMWVKMAGSYGSSIERVDDAVKLLTEEEVRQLKAMRDAETGAWGLNGSLDETNRAARRAADGVKTLGRDLGPTKEDIKDLKTEVDYYRTLVDGPVGEANRNYKEQLGELMTKAAKLRKEIDTLSASNGHAVTSQKKHALSAAELALAQQQLAVAQQKLSQETDPLKQAQLNVQIEKLTGKLGLAGQAVTTYIDNSKKIGELQGDYDTLMGSVEDLRVEHEKAIGGIIFNILAARVAQGDFGTEGVTLLATLGEKWGLLDADTATAMKGVQGAVDTFVQTGSLVRAGEQVDEVRNKLLGIPTQINVKVTISQEGKLELPENGGWPKTQGPPASSSPAPKPKDKKKEEPPNCFVAGTPVRVGWDSYQPIETIQPGDYVLAYNQVTRQVGASRVVKTIRGLLQQDVLVVLTLADGTVLTSTGAHPYAWMRPENHRTPDPQYLMHEGLYLRAAGLEVGDYLQTWSGGDSSGSIQIKKSQILRVVLPIQVYNLEVENHTYLVGSVGVQVHNKKAATGIYNWTVPAGFPGDSAPLYVETGEVVNVTPRGQRSPQSGDVYNVYVNDQESLRILMEQIRMRKLQKLGGR